MPSLLETQLAEALQNAAWIAHVCGGPPHKHTTFEACQMISCKKWKDLLAEYERQRDQERNAVPY